MLALWLLAAHLVGDFVLQTRWQAAGKLVDAGLRFRHCWTYSLAFMPVAAWRTWPDGAISWRYYGFMAGLFLLHYLTDSRRFRSTLGDVLEWNRRWWRVGPTMPPANPWEPLPILLDQALHVVQIAMLASVFLA